MNTARLEFRRNTGMRRNGYSLPARNMWQLPVAQEPFEVAQPKTQEDVKILYKWISLQVLWRRGVVGYLALRVRSLWWTRNTAMTCSIFSVMLKSQGSLVLLVIYWCSYWVDLLNVIRIFGRNQNDCAWASDNHNFINLSVRHHCALTKHSK